MHFGYMHEIANEENLVTRIKNRISFFHYVEITCEETGNHREDGSSQARGTHLGLRSCS